ncbi:hypothetical protein [Saccharothrix xinjiangensis]|uniref:TniQ protein n=1 Tax=Saccharothrix xinjiangensis TaxID=204798 RepID=A0ABV9XY28_9PSEU
MGSRLPIAVRPAANEIAMSYLARLAALHAMPMRELWDQVSARRRAYGAGRMLDTTLFTEVVNQPRARLDRAVVELRRPRPDWWSLRHEPQRGCHRCDAAHPGGTPLRLLGHHDYLCTRHRIWIGPPDQAEHPQPDLHGLPEVVTAQHAHRRLLRRLGPAATYDAVLTGFFLCAHRWQHHDPTGPGDAHHRWDRRARLLIPPGTETATFSPSRLFAATYPEAVALAGLLGPLHGRRLAAGGPDDQRRFAAEIARRLGLTDYRPLRSGDAIAHWIDQRCWQPPVLPHSSYRRERTFGGKTYRKPVATAEQTRRNTAAAFAEHRRGGAMILFHRTMAPLFGLTRALATSDTLTELDITPSYTRQHGTRSPLEAGHLRPEPTPTTWLDTATEPLPWTNQTGPRHSYRDHPYFPGG